MTKVNTPRLIDAAKEFNVGTSTLIEFLISKNFNDDDLKIGTKLSGEMYRMLQIEFQPDKIARQEVEQINLPKNVPADRKDESDK